MNLSPLAAATDTSTPAKGAAPGNAEVGSAFDNILALETLAAAAPSLDVTGLGDVILLDEGDVDEGTEGEIEDLLAFLSTLVNTVTTQIAANANAGAAGDDASPDALGSMAGGTAGQGDAGEPAALITNGADDSAAGDAVADKMAGTQGLAAAFMDGAAEPDAAKDLDSPASPTRGAEWLQPGARPAVASENHRIATPVRDPRWAEEFGTRIALMVRGGESSAALQLSPVELGPMDVSVTVRDSQASIHFGAAQAETRALIEASIPRLREMLAAQGFHLMDASVSQGFSRQAQPDPQATQGASTDAEIEAPAVRQVRLGLLDLYA